MTSFDLSQVTLPLTKGKIIVFRCDALGLNYSYRPKGTAGTAVSKIWAEDG